MTGRLPASTPDFQGQAERLFASIGWRFDVRRVAGLFVPKNRELRGFRGRDRMLCQSNLWRHDNLFRAILHRPRAANSEHFWVQTVKRLQDEQQLRDIAWHPDTLWRRMHAIRLRHPNFRALFP